MAPGDTTVGRTPSGRDDAVNASSAAFAVPAPMPLPEPVINQTLLMIVSFYSALNEVWYCSSLTFSIQSAVSPSSSSTMAMCVMAVVAVAPCQCFSPGGNQITSPRPNLLERASPALCQAAASCHDQGLAQRVAVPCCSSTRFERDTGAERVGRIILPGTGGQYVHSVHRDPNGIRTVFASAFPELRVGRHILSRPILWVWTLAINSAISARLRRVRSVFAGPFSMLTSLQPSPCLIQDGANRTRTVERPRLGLQLRAEIARNPW